MPSEPMDLDDLLLLMLMFDLFIEVYIIYCQVNNMEDLLLHFASPDKFDACFWHTQIY